MSRGAIIHGGRRNFEASRRRANIEEIPRSERPEGFEKYFGYRIACGRCGTLLDVHTRFESAADAVIERARSGGWQASDNGRHRCPSCVRKQSKTKEDADMAAPQKIKTFQDMPPPAPEVAVGPIKVETHTAPPAAADLFPAAHQEPAPEPASGQTEFRQPTPAQRRQVFREIEGSYDEVNGRYINGESDASIAARLKFPRKWIETIRDENFGPAGVDPAIAKIEAELKALQAKAKDLEDRGLRLAADAENLAGMVLAGLRELSRAMNTQGKAQ